jgi:hypothetical protein
VRTLTIADSVIFFLYSFTVAPTRSYHILQFNTTIQLGEDRIYPADELSLYLVGSQVVNRCVHSHVGHVFVRSYHARTHFFDAESNSFNKTNNAIHYRDYHRKNMQHTTIFLLLDLLTQCFSGFFWLVSLCIFLLLFGCAHSLSLPPGTVSEYAIVDS